jgi:hypothetical protein
MGMHSQAPPKSGVEASEAAAARFGALYHLVENHLPSVSLLYFLGVPLTTSIRKNSWRLGGSNHNLLHFMAFLAVRMSFIFLALLAALAANK